MTRCETISLPSGASLAHIGPDFTAGSLPAVFYFALSGEDSLCRDPFNQPAVHLAENDVRVFSLTLPCHGSDLHEREAMSYWAKEMESGATFLNPFFDSFAEALDLLEQKNLASEIAISGLSRGGFIALHLAALHDSIDTILAFAPLVSLAAGASFQHLSEEQRKQYEPSTLIPRLSKKIIRFYIGNRDTRVGTRACFEFIEALTGAAVDDGVRSPPIELIISPSIGQDGHGTAPGIFSDGANWLKRTLK